MNTILARLNAAFAYTLSVMAVLTFLCFASTFWNDNLTKVEIQTGNVYVWVFFSYQSSWSSTTIVTLGLPTKAFFHQLICVLYWLWLCLSSPIYLSSCKGATQHTFSFSLKLSDQRWIKYKYINYYEQINQNMMMERQKKEVWLWRKLVL